MNTSCREESLALWRFSFSSFDPGEHIQSDQYSAARSEGWGLGISNCARYESQEGVLIIALYS
jgi:hypothetical protein